MAAETIAQYLAVYQTDTVDMDDVYALKTQELSLSK
jgi:hypothetical protein